MKAARGDEDLPEATHEGVVEILGIKVRTYRLDDGRTLIHADDLELVLSKLMGEGPADGGARSD